MKFDFSSRKLYPIKNDNSIKDGIKLSWKDSKQYPGIPIGYIIFNVQISGKEIRFAFDTGSIFKKVPFW